MALQAPTVIKSGGLEDVLSGGITSNTVIDGGTLELQVGAAVAGPITFEDAGGMVTVDGTSGRVSSQ